MLREHVTQKLALFFVENLLKEELSMFKKRDHIATYITCEHFRKVFYKNVIMVAKATKHLPVGTAESSLDLKSNRRHKLYNSGVYSVFQVRLFEKISDCKLSKNQS